MEEDGLFWEIYFIPYTILCLCQRKKIRPNCLWSFISILGVLLLVAVGAISYLLGKSSSGGSAPIGKNLEITLISDARCNDCQEDALKAQLLQQPVLSGAELTEKDFADAGVEQYLKDNNIGQLPALILSHNNVGADLQGFLNPLSSGEYTLNIGAQFNPFVERSDRGFTQISQEQVADFLVNANVAGNSDAPIMWIEYSDLDCPACKAFYNSGISSQLLEKYDGVVNKLFQHFPLDSIHPIARKKAESIECIVDLTSNDEKLYDLVARNFEQWLAIFDFDSILEENGLLEDNFNTCLDSSEIKTKSR